MGSKITFYIVRHGKTILNTMDKVQGWSDTPLTKEGVEVVENLGKGLKDITFSSAFCSDLRRTRETLHIILKNSDQKGLSVIEKPELREICFGSYETALATEMFKDVALYLHYTNAQDLFNDIFDKNKEITYKEAVNTLSIIDPMKMAEDFNTVEKRMHKALSDIVEIESKYNENRNVLIVSHGLSINVMLYNLGGKKLFIKDLENASVCKLIFEDEKYMIEAINDMSYVEKGKNS
ncbi:MAG: histidine phosphatase family protein [Apibacter sp.]|jgi:broad specificity phosphatase PhoE|nr:histidine phosphatase family protein [Apibacter sp.]